MRVPVNIKTLLYADATERERIEFKETWDPGASLKTICAFANDIDNLGGGYLLIGVEERGGKPANLKGIPTEKTDSYLKDLFDKCKRIQPEYTPITEVIDYMGKKFIIVWAPGGPVRPYSLPKASAKGDGDRVYWIRRAGETVAPCKEEENELFALANNVPYDDRVNLEAEITDLNIDLIRSYLKETESPLYKESETMDFIDLCKSMNIVGTKSGCIKPKNVGLLFFCLDPERFFPYAKIDVVWFSDGTGEKVIDEEIFEGSLGFQLKSALLHIRNMFVAEHVRKIPGVCEAERFFNYPYEAIEEALVNAVCHKGYDVRKPIKVRAFPDRMEIVSHSGKERSLALDGLKNSHVPGCRYGNRRIGEFLKGMHLRGGGVAGFERMLYVLERNGSPEPLFVTDDGGTSFTVTLFIHPGFDEK